MSTYTQQKFNSFGDALSYALDIIKESPSDFSERTGIDKGRMSRYINNKTTPRPKTIKEIESLLGVSLDKRESGWVVSVPDSAQQVSNNLNHLEEGVSRLRTLKAADEDVMLTEDDSPTLIRLRKKYPELRHIIDKEIDRLMNNSEE